MERNQYGYTVSSDANEAQVLDGGLCKAAGKRSDGQKTFYYRLRVLREEACSLMNAESNKPAVKHDPEFVRVGSPYSVAGSSGIRIKLDSAEISISPDASSEHVRMVLEAIAHA